MMQGCPIGPNCFDLLLLVLIIDRLVKGPSAQMINLPAVEVIQRKMYGLIKAFEKVKEENDYIKAKEVAFNKVTETIK